jgi:hypothetical protein
MENNHRTGHAQINARRDCVDLASAGSGRRSENPPALAVGSVNNVNGYRVNIRWNECVEVKK